MVIVKFIKKCFRKIKAAFKGQKVYYVNGSDTLPPPLEPEVEESMIERISEQDARDALIEHNLRLVAHIVRKYYISHPSQDDLVSIGSIGLIKAVENFDISLCCQVMSVTDVVF